MSNCININARHSANQLASWSSSCPWRNITSRTISLHTVSVSVVTSVSAVLSRSCCQFSSASLLVGNIDNSPRSCIMRATCSRSSSVRLTHKFCVGREQPPIHSLTRFKCAQIAHGESSIRPYDVIYCTPTDTQHKCKYGVL